MLDAVIAATVGLAPLLILPGVFFYFDVTPKVVVLLAGASVTLMLKGRLECRTASPLSRWMLCLLTIQAVSLILSTLLSADPLLSLTGTNWRRFGLISQAGLLALTAVLTCHLTGNPSARILPLLRSLSIAGCLTASYGVAQYFGWDPILPSGSYHVGEGVWTIVRPPGTMGHASYFATWLLHAAFSGTALAAVDRTPAWKICGLASASLASAAVALSGTRAAVLGLLAGAALLAIRYRSRLRWRALAAVVVAVVAFGWFYVSPAGQKLRGRARWSVEDVRGGSRLWLWRDTLRYGLSHWAAGAGPETFTSGFLPHRSEELAAAYPDFFQESPHNIFLDAFAAQGFPGAALLLLLCGLGFHAARCAAAEHGPLPEILGAALLASLVSQQFTSFVAANALLLYATVAMLVALSPARGTPGSPARRTAGVLTRVPGLLLAAVLFLFAVRLLLADRALKQVQRHLAAGRLPQAVEDYERCRKRQLPGMNSDLWFSRSLIAAVQEVPDLRERLRYFDAAEKAAERAASHSEDRPNAYYNLAAFYARRNDITRAEKSLRQAIRHSPTWYKPHWMLARVLGASGRSAEAREEAALALRLGGSRHREVVETLAGLR